MNNQKYKAEKVERYGITFDSKLELRVYERIAEYIPQQNILTHHKLQITKSIGWKVDFITFPTLANPSVPLLLIEAKGYEMEIFRIKTLLLEEFIPELFNRLIVVYSYSHKLDENKRYMTTTENRIGLAVSKMAQLKVQLSTTDLSATANLLNLSTEQRT